jgi:hypothetical protein
MHPPFLPLDEARLENLNSFFLELQEGIALLWRPRNEIESIHNILCFLFTCFCPIRRVTFGQRKRPSRLYQSLFGWYFRNHRAAYSESNGYEFFD